MRKRQPDFNNNVFINCPFDPDYNRLFYAVVFTIHFAGFQARCSKELNDGSDRMRKIIGLIGNCKYGIHDISRVQPRFNMPFELGLDIGFQEGGNRKYKKKSHLILATHQYRYKKYLSDLAGRDTAAHNDRVADIIVAVRDWLNDAEEVKKRHPLPSGALIYEAYRKFRRRLPELCKESGLSMKHLTFSDYSYLVAKFIQLAARKE